MVKFSWHLFKLWKCKWSVPPIPKVGKNSPFTALTFIDCNFERREQVPRFNFKMNFSFLVKTIRSVRRPDRISDISSYYNFQIRYDSPSWKELNADRLVTIANHRFVCRLDPSKFYLNFPIIYVEKFSTLIQRKMEQWGRTFMSTYEVEAFQCKWTYQEFSGECSFLLNGRREECVETSEKRRGME